MRAWLVTWEWVGDHAAVEQKVAAILNPRRSGEHIRDIVELLYVNARFSLSERLAYARNKRNTPYPAQFGTINGAPYTGQVTCGHNPYLYARLVEDLRVEQGSSGDEALHWTERPRPALGRLGSQE